MEDARSLPDQELDPSRRCQERLAEAARRFHAGEFRSSASEALEAGELAKQAGRADLLCEAALVVDGLPDAATAPAVERLCRDALLAVDPGDTAVRARLHSHLAVALHHRGRLVEADVEVERALALASESGQPRAQSAALNAQALAMAGLDHGEALLDVGTRLLDAAAASGSIQAELQAHSWRIEALFRLGDTAGAAHAIDSLDVLAARSGDRLVRWNARLARAGLAQAVGRLADAERLAREARDVLPAEQRPQTEPLFIAQLMLVSTDRGVEPAEIGIARGLAIGAPAISVAMTGRYDLEMGDLERARASFEAVRPRLGAVALDRRGLATLTAGVELAVAFGDAIVASELHGRLAPFDGAMIASSLGAVGPVSYYLGRAEGLLGRHDEAVAHARAAIELSARGDFGPWLSRSRLALAEALVQRDAAGDRDDARRAATLTAVTARELEMGALLVRALALLDRLGPRARISAREREIAGLVATGTTNREMARTLGLSERTVETHVQNLLTKLGFHSRAQIAVWAVGEGIAADGPADGRRGT